MKFVKCSVACAKARLAHIVTGLLNDDENGPPLALVLHTPPATDHEARLSSAKTPSVGLSE
jgi:hypothetical protein